MLISCPLGVIANIRYRFDFPAHGLPSYDSMASTQISPTPVVKPAPIRIRGKENGQPETQGQLRVQRTVPTPHIFPPQVFYDPYSNPLYNPLNSFSRPFGYTYQSPYTDDFKPQNGFNVGFQGDFKPLPSMPRSQSQQGYGADPSNNNTNSMHFGI